MYISKGFVGANINYPTLFKLLIWFNSIDFNLFYLFDFIVLFYGHMSQTGPKKCFIPQNCEKYTNFDSTEHNL